MEELNVVDWASQRPSISGTWQPKLNMKGKHREQPHHLAESGRYEGGFGGTRLIGRNDIGDLSNLLGKSFPALKWVTESQRATLILFGK